MLIGGIALGLLLGLLLGGRLERLAEIRLRFLPLLFVAVIVRFGTETMLSHGVAAADTLRLPLFALSYGLLLYALWHNRGYPGLALAFIGILSNAVVILVNGGRMPVWLPAYTAAGFTPPISTVLHTVLPAGSAPDFFLHLGPLADVIPIPVPVLNNVASVGDLFLTAGLAFFLFATLLRGADEIAAAMVEARLGRYVGVRLPRPDVNALDEAGLALRPGTGLMPALEAGAALERPQLMGAAGVGMASPSYTTQAPVLPGIARRRRSLALSIRRHPYVHLALNPSFSALWVGQVISLFGDRVNQIALAAAVFEVTKSPLQVALTFFVATLPNLLFSPLAGTFVDRWDQKQVLVVSDILRAALVLMVPVAVLIDVWLAYPLVFLITTVSIFFRPARSAVLPRIVPDEDLLAANSAMWVAETLADVVNYPIAGLFVLFLASSLPVAFWFDAATYLASAGLIATMIVPPLMRRARGEEGVEAGPGVDDTEAFDGEDLPAVRPGVFDDLREGWGFLRHETVLLANTLQGAAGQFAAGILTASTLILAQHLTPGTHQEYVATYAFMETSIGAGNLVGGFALGMLAARSRKGPIVAGAYAAFGVLLILVGISDAIPVTVALLFGVGIANMAYVIPSQTLFQQRTPPELMGRVVSFRFTLVFGGMSIAMAVAGLLLGVLSPGLVIGVGGLISVAAGVAGFLVREVREA
jgi:DHA3 family macrolide efflux protein-like MFS transporter